MTTAPSTADSTRVVDRDDAVTLARTVGSHAALNHVLAHGTHERFMCGVAVTGEVERAPLPEDIAMQARIGNVCSRCAQMLEERPAA